MKIMWVEAGGELAVMNVVFASYTDDKDYYDENKNIKAASGLYVQDMNGDEFLIPGYSRVLCDSVVRGLFEHDKVTLTGRNRFTFRVCYNEEKDEEY